MNLSEAKEILKKEALMNEILETAKAQLEERAKALKWEVERTIDEKVQVIENQLRELAQLQVPADVLKLYTEVGGKMWVSKRIWVEDERSTPKILHGPRYLFFANTGSSDPEFMLPQGAYRLVLMAIPATITGERDDYGMPVSPPGQVIS